MKQLHQKHTIKITVVLLAGVGLTACVPHLNQQQCLSMNWYQLGYQDGSQGHFQRNLSQDIQDCARFKLTVNTKAYSRGWHAGVRSFCRPENGYNLGVNGVVYPNICPASMAAKFDQAWRRGLRRFCVPDTGYNLGRSGASMPNFCAPDQVAAFRNAYVSGHRRYDAAQDIKGQIDNTNSQIADLNNQIQDQRDDIDALQQKLIRNRDKDGKPYSPAERELILTGINNDRRAIRHMQRHIDQLQNQINDLQDQLNRLQSR